MKAEIERRKPGGLLDYLSLALTTWGVGYIPGAPGTYGSLLGVSIFLAVREGIHSMGLVAFDADGMEASPWATVAVCVGMLVLTLAGIWAAGRSTELLGSTDAPEAVVDEVIGQLVVFLFVPFNIGWPLIVAGFLLFRMFDVWKPYPIDSLQGLPAGIGVCADDILAGVYAGICLAFLHALSISI
jgi:phosphatidylglycerophosphatase A